MIWNFANDDVERIGSHAMIRGKIGSVAGVQLQLDALAKDPTFQEIYDQEC